jgi:hypothetical protein
MKPFKLKKEFAKEYKVLTTAQEIFGTPVDGLQHIDPYPKCESTWKFWDNFFSFSLTISQIYNSDRVLIDYREENLNYYEMTISINLKNYVPNRGWADKLKKFIDVITKPWSDWTEEELLENPMWIYYFHKENSIPTELHNAMVLFSYENPNDPWVRKYFDEISTHDHELATPSPDRGHG